MKSALYICLLFVLFSCVKPFSRSYSALFSRIWIPTQVKYGDTLVYQRGQPDTVVYHGNYANYSLLFYHNKVLKTDEHGKKSTMAWTVGDRPDELFIGAETITIVNLTGGNFVFRVWRDNRLITFWMVAIEL